MKILALEFSSSLRSAAVADGERVLGAAREAHPRETGPVALVDAALRAAALGPADVDVVAVSLGPGSYHGVRVAIAMAQAWELGRGVRLRGVDTPGCLAAQAYALGVRGVVDVVIDAQRGEFYSEGFELDEEGWRRVASLRLAAFDTLMQRASTGAQLLSPEKLALDLPVSVVVPDAAMVARLAASGAGFVEGAALEPIYLRETQFVKAPAARTW